MADSDAFVRSTWQIVTDVGEGILWSWWFIWLSHLLLMWRVKVFCSLPQLISMVIRLNSLIYELRSLRGRLFAILVLWRRMAVLVAWGWTFLSLVLTVHRLSRVDSFSLKRCNFISLLIDLLFVIVNIIQHFSNFELLLLHTGLQSLILLSQVCVFVTRTDNLWLKFFR